MAKVFFSYSHKDEWLRDLLDTHLSMLKNEGLIEIWHDRRIEAGNDIDASIDHNLEEADIILLLISSDFLSSRYCWGIEVKRAMERHAAATARVIPVILRACDWHSAPFGKLLATPTDGKAITTWPNLDEAFLDVVRKIREAVKSTKPKPAPAGDTTGASSLTVQSNIFRDYRRPHLGHLSWVFRRIALEQSSINIISDPQTSALVLVGLPGIGKTILLAEVANRLSREFDHVLTLTYRGAASAEPTYLIEEVNAFLTALGHGVAPNLLHGQSIPRSLNMLADRLPTSRLLIAIDSADAAPDDQVRLLLTAFLGACPKIKIVMTARNWTASGSRVRSLTVPPLSEVEARAFIDQYTRERSIEIDLPLFFNRIPIGIRGHPQALAALLASLDDVPLELLLLDGLPEAARAPIELIKAVLANINGSIQTVLASIYALDSQEFVAAQTMLVWPPAVGLTEALSFLLARSLIVRDAGRYYVPEIVGSALDDVAPKKMSAARKMLDRRLRLAVTLAVKEPDHVEMNQLASIIAQGAVRLHSWERWSGLLALANDPFLELINLLGFWKEYWLLLRLSAAAAAAAKDDAAHVRLAFRIARKSLEMRSHEAGRLALAKIEPIVSADRKSLAYAQYLSHRAFFYEFDGELGSALALLEESRQIYDSHSDLQSSAIAHLLIGNVLLGRKEFAESEQYYENALVRLEHFPQERKAKVDAQLGIAFCKMETADTANAMERLKTILDSAQRAQYRAGLARAYYYLALGADRLGNRGKAVDYSARAVEYAQSTTHDVLVGAAILNCKSEHDSTKNVAGMENITSAIPSLEELRARVGDILARQGYGLDPSRTSVDKKGSQAILEFLIAGGHELTLTNDSIDEIATEIGVGLAK
jgi:hypothetical protein